MSSPRAIHHTPINKPSFRHKYLPIARHQPQLALSSPCCSSWHPGMPVLPSPSLIPRYHFKGDPPSPDPRTYNCQDQAAWARAKCPTRKETSRFQGTALTSSVPWRWLVLEQHPGEPHLAH